MAYPRALALCVFVCACAPLIAQGQGGDPKQRVRAARELARHGSSDGIPKLQAMLSDPVPEVRIEAVKALTEIGTRASLDPLIQATRDNDAEVQIRATDGLVNFYLPGYVKVGFGSSIRRVGGAIKGRFTDTTDQVIDPYVEARPEVIDALGKLARGGASIDARANAARAVGILRGKAAIPDLVQALHSNDDQVMYECLTAIQKIGDPEAAPKISFLLRDLNDKILIAAAETTGLLRNRDALPQLRSVLADARNNKVRRAALGAIAMMPDEASRPLYQRYLNDRDDGLRAAAAEGFARLKNPRDLPALEKKFNDEGKMSARLSDAFAVVMLGKTDRSEFSPLQYLVNSLNSAMWKGVARAFLVELARDSSVRRPLEAAMQYGTRDEKIELAHVLAASGDKETVRYLEALTRDPDSEVAEVALSATRALKARLP